MTPAAASGLAVDPDPVAAARTASRAAVERAGAGQADLALVFVSGEAAGQARGVLDAVEGTTGARTVVGCSGAGVLTERGEVEGTSAVAVLVVSIDRRLVGPFVLPGFAALGEGAGARLASAAADTVLAGGSVVILPDARGLDPRALLTRFEEALGFVPVLGAVAAGMPLIEFGDGDLTEGGLAGLAIGGATPVIGVAQGCVPIGEPYVITRAEGPLVLTIGSRPALAVLREAIETLPSPQERIRRAGVFAGLAIDPAKSPLDRGDFLVRNLVGIDEQSGAIAVGEATRVGQTIQFQIRDAEAARADLVGMLDAVAAELGERRPLFGCYFNCAGRGRGLFGTPDHDVRLIRARLGSFPLVGFFGNGEFAPIARQNFFHTYTGVLALFARAEA